MLHRVLRCWFDLAPKVSANLVEPDEDVLVLNCGYFAQGFADWFVLHRSASKLKHDLAFVSLQAYGAKVNQLKSEIGGTVKLSDIEGALKQKKYKLITVTHVDTSTGAWPCRLYIIA